MKTTTRKQLLALLVGAGLTHSSPLLAEATRFHVFEGFASFIEGEPKGVAVGSDGALSLAPVAQRYFDAQEGRIAARCADDERVALVFAESGRIVVVKDGGKAEEWGEAPKGVPTAIALDGKLLYVATMAPTALYRFDAPKKFEKLELPKVEGKDVTQIWALHPTRDALLVGTGLPGRLFKYAGKKHSEIFKPSDTVVRSVTTDKHGNIYVGGGTQGIVYRGAEKGGFTALHDSGLDEILEMTVNDDGTVYFVGLGGASRDQKGERVAEKGKIRSQLIKVDAEGFFEALAGSDDEIIYSVAPTVPGRVLVGSASVDKESPRGRVYSTNTDTREVSMVHQSSAAQIIAVIARPKGRYVAVTNEPAGLESMEASYRREGEIALSVFDAGTPSRFGSVQLEAQQPVGTSLAVRIRSGHTQDPDETWSAWSKDLPIGIASPEVPVGRYVQAKLVMRSDGNKTPVARRVRVAYVRQNLPPYVGEVALLAKGVALSALPGDVMRERTVMLNDKGLSELKRIDTVTAPPDGGTRSKQSIVPGSLTVAWVAQDPNGDDLRFDLQFRSEGELEWKLLQAGLENPFYSFVPYGLADGRYQFRVIAKDDVSNSPGQAKHEIRESVWFSVDNTPPVLGKISIDKQRLSVSAQDAMSPIIKAEFSLDGLPMRPLLSNDGLLDSSQESFSLSLPEKKSGSHTVSIRVEDEGGNAAMGTARY